MSEQENFDDSIRHKFAEKEFVFNEENWEKMEKKIDTARKRKKFFLWILIFMTGISCGLGLSFLYVKNSNENTKSISELNYQKNNKSEILNKENSHVEKSASTPSKSNENNFSQKEETEKNSAEAQPVSKINNPEKIEKNNQGQKLASDNPQGISSAPASNFNKETIITKKENKIYNTETRSIADKASSSVKQAHENDANKSARATNKVSEKIEADKLVAKRKKSKKNDTFSLTTGFAQDGTKKNEINSTMNSNSLLEKKSQKNASSVSSSPINTVEKLNTKNHSIAIASPGKPKAEAHDETNSTSLPEKKSQKIESAATSPQSTKDGKFNNEPQIAFQMSSKNAEEKNNFETDSTLPLQIFPLLKDSVHQKSDSIVIAKPYNLMPSAPIIPGGLASATFISIEAGTNYELGWKYADATEARGFNPVLGIEITHFINQKWSIYSGVEYGTVAYLKVSQKIVSNTTYDFGSATADKIIDTKLLHYAVVPILIQYHFNNRNAISIGGSISYLVNSRSKVTVNTATVGAVQSDSSENLTPPQKIETGYYANAFNNWDASLALGYRRRISEKFSAAAIANFGLLDIKNNVFFSREKFERNIGFKITISYNLFDF